MPTPTPIAPELRSYVDSNQTEEMSHRFWPSACHGRQPCFAGAIRTTAMTRGRDGGCIQSPQSIRNLELLEARTSPRPIARGPLIVVPWPFKLIRIVSSNTPTLPPKGTWL